MLTRALHGEDLPKQYATIHGRRSLLQETVSRASRWSLPSRIVVVVSADREKMAREQLRDYRDVDVVAQPQNLGTGPGVLLPLSRVLAKDPKAQVVILPSDHYVRIEETFAGSVLRAERISHATDSVTLVGAIPDRAEAEYGWIVPRGGEGAGQNIVARFHEKPAVPIAEHLMKSGALWNTFIMTGPARRFWDLGRTHLPIHSALLDSYRELVGTANELEFLRDIYTRFSPADFSRDVIEKADGLGVVTLSSCGWSDWGTPERVLRSLEGTRVGVDLSAKLMNRVAIEENFRFAPTNAMTELVEA
jgi:mannose-1-phosphate guanylyltransferase